MIPSIDSAAVFIYVFGLISGYTAVRYRLTVSDRASEISDHLKDLEKLHEAAIAFWSRPFEAESGGERRVRVLSNHAIAMRIYPRISLMALGNSSRYEDLISQYFRACTGGDFDDPNRPADLATALELARIHAQLVEVLRHIRGNLSSVSMLLKDIAAFIVRAWREFHYTFLIP